VLIKSENLSVEFRCPECGYLGKSCRGLGKHFAWKHPEIEKAALWARVYGLQQTKCKCGCGQDTPWSSKPGYVGYNDFIMGHNLNTDDPWNKGLSKDTDERILKSAVSTSKSVKKKWEEGDYDDRRSNASSMNKNQGWFPEGSKPWNKGLGHPSVYGPEFSKELRRTVRELFRNRCVRCDAGDSLVVHHIDTDKTNNDIENLMLLCRRCHMKIHSDISKSKGLDYHVGLDVSSRVAGLKLRDFRVELIDYANAKNKIIKNHYTHTCPKPKFSFGLVHNGFSYGIVIFSMPSRQNIAASLGYENGDVLELSRMFIHEGMPKNSGSYLIAKTIKYLKGFSKYKAVVTYADSTEGHTGTLYKASNFLEAGVSRANYHYEDAFGNRFHKRAVWSRAKKCDRTEREQAEVERLVKVVEKEKYRFIYRLAA